MLYNYFNIAIRNLLKNRVHTVINILGLAFGITCVFLITIYINHELSYDRFHNRAEDLYRISWEDENPQTRTPHPMAQALANDFPEVENAVSLTPLWGAGLTRETHAFKHPQKNERYDERNILSVDTTFFQVFDFPLVKGDPKTALKKINGVLISESMARKYFGDEDPIGKHLAVDSASYLVEVVAVFKDVPANSHFHFDFLVSYLREKYLNPGSRFYSWADFGHYNYVRLKPGTDAKQLEAKLMDWSKKYLDWSSQNYESLAARKHQFRLRPVTDIHLKSRLHWELEANGNIDYIYILGAAALFTLIIACVNFMNLTTAKSAERAKEIGVRKTMGAFRSQLSLQFLAESVSVALIAVLLSFLIIESVLPMFNIFTGLSLEIHYLTYVPILLGGGIVVGIISGLYPSLYLSGVKPHLVLKGKLAQTPQGSSLRRTLIVLQFSISMILISSAVIIFSQLDFLRKKNLGFGKDEVIVIPVKNDDGMPNFDAFRNELLRLPGVTSVSASSNIPGTQFNQHAVSLVNKPMDRINSSEAYVDYDFFKALGIAIAEGRTFVRDSPTDGKAFVLNETAARQLSADGSMVGREILWNHDDEVIRGTVIGVVKDFNFQSLHEPVRPLLFMLSGDNFNYMLIKLETGDFKGKIASIEKLYKTFETTFGFEFSFLEDQLNDQYAEEEKAGNILGIFSGIAILIACFGLFGMSMLMFYQKAKEVSVRKVLGATPYSLLVLLLGNFTKLIVVAIVIASPATWYVMKGWLNNFTYQVTIQPLTFILSGLSLILIAWITLSYFTVKTSRLNPAETLKNE